MTEPFDAEAFARQTIQAIEFGDDDAELIEDRVIRLEQVAAARWPRSLILRWRLAREIRASVSGYPADMYPRADFRGRRVQWASETVTTVRQERRRER